MSQPLAAARVPALAGARSFIPNPPGIGPYSMSMSLLDRAGDRTDRSNVHTNPHRRPRRPRLARRWPPWRLSSTWFGVNKTMTPGSERRQPRSSTPRDSSWRDQEAGRYQEKTSRRDHRPGKIAALWKSRACRSPRPASADKQLMPRLRTPDRRLPGRAGRRRRRAGPPLRRTSSGRHAAAGEPVLRSGNTRVTLGLWPSVTTSVVEPPDYRCALSAALERGRNNFRFPGGRWSDFREVVLKVRTSRDGGVFGAVRGSRAPLPEWLQTGVCCMVDGRRRLPIPW